MKKVLVTGGAGFIGSHFVNYLVAQQPSWQVSVIDKLTYAGNLDNLREVEALQVYSFQQGDITSQHDVDRAFETSPEVIINFAAETHVDRSIGTPDDFIMTDVIGTHTLLKKVREKNVPLFIQISTDEVYGSIKEGSFNEHSALNPSSPYSASKAGADALVRAYQTTYGLQTIIIRLSNNFGPNQYPEKFLPLMITNLIEGKKIPVYGDGKNVRDWLYVKDAVAGIYAILEKGIPGNIYHIAGENERQNIDVVSYILDRMNLPSSYIEYITDRPGHDRRYSLACEETKALGWKAQHSFEENINATIDWYTKNDWWWKKIKQSEGYQNYYKKQYKTM